MKEEVYLEYGQVQYDVEEILQKAKEKFVEEGHTEDEIKSMQLYIKPIDNRAYYVINEDYESYIFLH